MIEPIVGLELNPSRGQQIERRGRDEPIGLPHHELLADGAGVRRPELLLGRLGAVLAGEVAPEAHARAAHQGQLERVVLAVRVARIQEALVLEGVAVAALGRSVGVAIVQVVGAQRDAQEGEIEGPEETGQLVPRHEPVEKLKRRDRRPLNQGRLKLLLGFAHIRLALQR